MGISDSDSLDLDTIEEQYEEEVFKITSFFLNRAFIPKLARAKIERLYKLQDAYAYLSGGENAATSDTKIDFDFHSLASLQQLIAEEQKAEMRLKLALSNAQTAESATIALHQWIQMMEQYAECFIRLFPKLETETPNVPMTQIVDYGALLAEIKNGTLDGLAVQEYARLTRII